jgi:carbamoyltransferase
MADHAEKYFEMPVRETPYMQFVAEVKEPNNYPAITHKDNTARVQTLTRAQHPALYSLLEEFYGRTGCPMLLNTSLNIKGEPLVNTWDDALRFQKLCGVTVF